MLSMARRGPLAALLHTAVIAPLPVSFRKLIPALASRRPPAAKAEAVVAYVRTRHTAAAAAARVIRGEEDYFSPTPFILPTRRPSARLADKAPTGIPVMEGREGSGRESSANCIKKGITLPVEDLADLCICILRWNITTLVIDLIL